MGTIKTLCFSTDCFSEELIDSLKKSNLERIGFELYPRSNERDYQAKLIQKLLDALESNPSIKEVAVCDYTSEYRGYKHVHFVDSKPTRSFKLMTGQDASQFRDAYQ